jgi:HK97 gp10 family phage protein
VELHVTTRGFEAYSARMASWPAVFQKHMSRSVTRIVIYGEGLAKKIVKRDTSHLARSITHNVKSTAGSVRGTWGTGLSPHYGPDVEFGTRPHWPPVSALIGWANRHGANPYAVAAGIAKHGTKAQPFMRPSFRQTVARARQELRAGLRAALAEMKG